MMRRQHQDHPSKVFDELSSLVFSLLRSPDQSAVFNSDSQRPMTSSSSISPAGFASLMLGISMALMLCGSVTFFIGFLLMPWVLGLVMVSTLSVLGKSILCCASPPPKEIPGKYSVF